jgi:protease IV
MKMALSRSGKWALGIVGGLFVLFILFWVIMFVALVRPSDDGMRISRGANIAVVEVNGVIVDSEETVRQLKRYADNKNVKAILLRVDSPGGGVAASQEIYEEVKRIVDNEKPVIVSMGSVAASGGYYISLHATRIVANPGTITGSIGVISQFIHLNEMLDKVGIDITTIKSGKYKDSGSMYRSMEKFEEEYWQVLMDDVYHQFITAVSEAREIDEMEAFELAEGKIYTGKQAYEKNLIDTLGTYEDAIRIAAELSGIDGEPTIVRERPRRTFWDSFFGAMTNDLTEIRDVLLRLPPMQYRMPDPVSR